MNLTLDNEIRAHIKQRMKDLNFTQAFICEDAKERGEIIDKHRLSKYLSGKKGGISDRHLLWIATRLGVYINIKIGKQHRMPNGDIEWKLSPYNEIECLTRINILFGGKKG